MSGPEAEVCSLVLGGGLDAEGQCRKKKLLERKKMGTWQGSLGGRQEPRDAHCRSCHDVPRCLCLCDVSTAEVRADPTEGRKSGLLEFRTFLHD